MAKKTRPNATAAVRALLTQQPNISPADAAVVLKARGSDVSPAYFSNIKSALKRARKQKRKHKLARKAPAHFRAPNPPTAVTLATIVNVRELLHQLGVNTLLELIDALR